MIRSIFKTIFGIVLMILSFGFITPFVKIIGPQAGPEATLILSIVAFVIMVLGVVMFFVGIIQFIIRTTKSLIWLGRTSSGLLKSSQQANG